MNDFDWEHLVTLPQVRAAITQTRREWERDNWRNGALSSSEGLEWGLLRVLEQLDGGAR